MLVVKLQQKKRHFPHLPSLRRVDTQDCNDGLYLRNAHELYSHVLVYEFVTCHINGREYS
jgi:hypothetical protein